MPHFIFLFSFLVLCGYARDLAFEPGTPRLEVGLVESVEVRSGPLQLIFPLVVTGHRGIVVMMDLSK